MSFDGAKESSAIRSALLAAQKAGTIPRGKYEVTMRSSDLTTVRFVLGAPELRFYGARWFYGELTGAGERNEQGVRDLSQIDGMSQWSPHWNRAADQIVAALNTAGIDTDYAPGVSRPSPVNVVTPSAYVSLTGSEQFVVERSMRLREVRLLRAAFPDDYLRRLFTSSEEEVLALVKRAAETYSTYLDFDPGERGWAHHFGQWERDSTRAIVSGPLKPEDAAHPVSTYAANQAWLRAGSERLIEGQIPSQPVPGVHSWPRLPPEAQYAWVVFDYRERAHRYDFLKAGWSTNLEAAILDAEAALAEMHAAGRKRR